MSEHKQFQGEHYTARLARNAGGNFDGTWASDAGQGQRTFWVDLPLDRSTEDVSTEHNRFVDGDTEFITIIPSPTA